VFVIEPVASVWCLKKMFVRRERQHRAAAMGRKRAWMAESDFGFFVCYALGLRV
jgi:hypothetical protein